MILNKAAGKENRKRPGLVRRGVQKGTIDKVAAQVSAAENASTQEFEIRQVPLSRIQLWEAQPRTFHLTLDDVYRGFIEESDGSAGKKKDELEAVIGLALSIREFGMLNAPLAYALPGKDVQLLGGQRRTMASIFALFHIRSTLGADDVYRHDVRINKSPDREALESERIAVKVFSRRPDDINIEQIGMMDNAQRSELPIKDKLRWALKYALIKEENKLDVGWRDLVDILGLNRSQAYQWLKVIQERGDKWVAKVIPLVLDESVVFKRLSDIAAADAQDREALYKSWFEKRPTSDKQRRVSLGVSSNLPAIRDLVMSNVSGKAVDEFAEVEWDKPKEVKKAFANFLKYWEESHG